MHVLNKLLKVLFALLEKIGQTSSKKGDFPSLKISELHVLGQLEYFFWIDDDLKLHIENEINVVKNTHYRKVCEFFIQVIHIHDFLSQIYPVHQFILNRIFDKIYHREPQKVRSFLFYKRVFL